MFDSCTFAWQTGQRTIRAAEEEEEVVLEEGRAVEAAAACCAADGFVLSDGSLLIVFWKKSKMEAELLCACHALFLDPFKAADEQLSGVLEPGFGVLESQLCDGFPKPSKSSIDFCRVFFVSLLFALLWGLGIFTGEPLMLTNALALPTDFLTGGFSPAIHFPLSSRLGRTGEPRALFGDEGANSFLGEKVELVEEVLATGATCLWEAAEEAEDCGFPPSTKPLPLNGIIFRMSCNPEHRNIQVHSKQSELNSQNVIKIKQMVKEQSEHLHLQSLHFLSLYSPSSFPLF